MSDSIIRVEQLGKKYIIGHQQNQEGLRHTLNQGLTGLGKRLLGSASVQKQKKSSGREEFWALKDVCFEIKPGEVVGIIGRNGAGKSTLLKILSRITEPTQGRITLRGRVASLLEVGTGFHPELTGRENIYLNGAILGMSRAEIKRKFDEIVAFAEVEKFLDTPVKRYSSGMYVRLAFAVAAHLEPEILVVDEVLAVGDAQFQKKCLGKMSQVSKQEGRTVLFVSHQMAAISNLCPCCMLLHDGNLITFSDTRTVINHYLTLDSAKKEQRSIDKYRSNWAKPLIKSVRLLDVAGNEQDSFLMGSNIVLEMTFETSEDEGLKAPVMGIVINHLTFGMVGTVNTRMSGYWLNEGPYSSATMLCLLKRPPLVRGEYTVDFWLGDGSVDLDNVNGYLQLSIEDADIYGSGHSPFSEMGAIYFEAGWDFFPDIIPASLNKLENNILSNVLLK